MTKYITREAECEEKKSWTWQTNSHIKAGFSSISMLKIKCSLLLFKWTGTCIPNSTFILNLVYQYLVWREVRNKTVPFAQTHAGCERHRGDLAKPWPGYPASPSTQCGQETQIGTTPTQVQGKCMHGVALSFPNQLHQSTMAAESFMFMSYPNGDTHIH